MKLPWDELLPLPQDVEFSLINLPLRRSVYLSEKRAPGGLSPVHWPDTGLGKATTSTEVLAAPPVGIAIELRRSGP